LPAAGQENLLALSQSAGAANGNAAVRLARVRELYDQAGVFEKAHRLIDKHRERAEKIADELEPEELRALLYYLIDSVLDHMSPDPQILTSIQ